MIRDPSPQYLFGWRRPHDRFPQTIQRIGRAHL